MRRVCSNRGENMENKIMIVEKIDRLDNSVPFRAKFDGKYGYVNSDNDIVVPFDYDDADQFLGDLAVVKRNGFMGVINKQGKEVVPCEYEGITICRDGLILVYKKGKWGYFNKRGDVVVPCIYERLSSFHNGVANVEIAGEFGVVDIRGRAYFGKEASRIAEKYNELITKEKSIIQKMIDNARTEKEVLDALFKGKRKTNAYRSEMHLEIIGDPVENVEEDDLEDIKLRASESIKWY